MTTNASILRGGGGRRGERGGRGREGGAGGGEGGGGVETGETETRVSDFSLRDAIEVLVTSVKKRLRERHCRGTRRVLQKVESLHKTMQVESESLDMSTFLPLVTNVLKSTLQYLSSSEDDFETLKTEVKVLEGKVKTLQSEKGLQHSFLFFEHWIRQFLDIVPKTLGFTRPDKLENGLNEERWGNYKVSTVHHRLQDSLMRYGMTMNDWWRLHGLRRERDTFSHPRLQITVGNVDAKLVDALTRLTTFDFDEEHTIRIRKSMIGLNNILKMLYGV